MPHVLVAGRLHEKGRAILEGAKGITVDYTEGSDEASYAAHLPQADALLIRTQPLTGGAISTADRLRIVSRHGVGYDAVDVKALTSRGIALAVCGDVNASSVAEHAMMMILACSKRAIAADRAIREGNWGWRDGLESQDLAGRNLMLIGYGRIGRLVARMAAGFGVTIRAFDPYLAESGWPEGEVTSTDLAEGLAWADIINVSVPRGVRPLLTNREFDLMRPGAILVNTARGGVVEEAALIRALASGQVGAAGLDVFDTEPLPPDHPFTQTDRVILSPHIAGVTEQAAERMAVGSAQNIVDFFGGRLDPALVVNLEELDEAR